MPTAEKPKYPQCENCNGSLELVEIDKREGTRILKCSSCGFIHHYRKGILGGWMLVKATIRE
jgi:uncharacterized Zn finger protein